MRKKIALYMPQFNFGSPLKSGIFEFQIANQSNSSSTHRFYIDARYGSFESRGLIFGIRPTKDDINETPEIGSIIVNYRGQLFLPRTDM